MLGAKKESALLRCLQCLARPSCATARPISRTSGTFHVAAMPMEHGKTVARPAHAIPCEASLKPSETTCSRSQPPPARMPSFSSGVSAASSKSRRTAKDRLALYQAHWPGGSMLHGGATVVDEVVAMIKASIFGPGHTVGGRLTRSATR